MSQYTPERLVAVSRYQNYFPTLSPDIQRDVCSRMAKLIEEERRMLVMKLMVEGLCLGALLVVVCAVGIKNGAIGMVHLYDKKVQDRVIQLGMTTGEAIRRRSVRFRSLCIPAYMAYVLVCVYAVNGARGFLPGFWQGLVILSIMNLIDRILIDGYWVGHTDAWVIPGTEDLRPYIAAKDKQRKWLMGTVGMAAVSAALAGIMALVL